MDLAAILNEIGQEMAARTERGRDTQVHVLGTGCVGFHTDTLRPSPRRSTGPSTKSGGDTRVSVLAVVR